MVGSECVCLVLKSLPGLSYLGLIQQTYRTAKQPYVIVTIY